MDSDSLRAAPFIVSGKIKGFLGVDHPSCHTEDLLLLSLAAAVCYREISNRRKADVKQERAEMELIDRVKIIQSLSEIYTSVYSIDMSTGQFTVLSSLQPVHAHIGASGMA